MLCFASCPCRVDFYGRNSVGLSGIVSLISLSGCFGVALSFFCVGSFVVLGFYLLVAPLFLVLSSSRFTGIHNSHLILYVIKGWMQVGEYFMVFVVPTSKKQIGNPLEKYSSKCHNSPN